ncbi:hypothetical protein [Natronorarus salvus]|uniref:hypothetical protein n=1 Tax=Natronorarus salvus TaxID=3117733 RepID=UPI002F26A94E
MSSVSEFVEAVSRAEEAYEFMISYAGQGIGREIPTKDVREIRIYLNQLREALQDSVTTGKEIPEEFDIDGEEHFYDVVDQMEVESEDAVEILDLLIAQDRITSQQVDNLNGMSVFQSIVMKMFFLEEIVGHLDE